MDNYYNIQNKDDISMVFDIQSMGHPVGILLIIFVVI